MKTFKFILVLGFMAAAAAPAFAMETSAAAPAQTLSEFQRANTGTKPIVAFVKYNESKFLSQFPEVTLNVSNLRTDATGSGTKPLIKPSLGSAHSWQSGAVSSHKTHAS